MKYLVANFNIDCAQELLQTAQDLLASLAGEAGFESFEETEHGLKGYVQESLLNRKALDDSLQAFPLTGTTITYTLESVPDQDWNEAWEQQGFEPVVIDDHIVIFDAKTPLKDCHFGADTLPIAIDAKQAFGTGTHETTQMIVSTLLHMNLKGKRVLDCGCGTGILGIAACKLGAKSCLSYDIDEWSVKNTRHNAKLNQVNNLTVLNGDVSVLSHTSGLFDVVLANINRNILIHDMPSYREVMSHDARLILSGFYEQDIPLLTERAASCGLKPFGRKQRGEWWCLVFACA